MADYRVEVNDRAGLYTEATAASWPACLALVRELARKYPDKIVCACNQDLLDVDTDGLTDDERDELVVAVDEARRV